MNGVNILLSLLARTDGRDQILRLIQYSCLHSVEHKIKGSRFKVYGQIRMVRKILRFLRQLQLISKIINEFSQLKKNTNYFPNFLDHLTKILQDFFNILFFLSDHKTFLGQIGLVSITKPNQLNSKRMRFYFLQNLFGIINNLIQMGLEIMKGHKNERIQQVRNRVKKHTFDLIRCLLDCIVAIYHWRGQIPAKKIGILGVVTSLMAIIQILGLM